MNDFSEKEIKKEENKKESEKENKSENLSARILIALALFMAAGLVGYNAFFSKSAVEISESLVAAETLEQNQETKSENKNEAVNINTASSEGLEKLSGIGKAMAKRIIDYRETHGGFANKEEIMNVKGIGKKVFENIKNNICV